jgi:hypothetical protein
MKYLLVLLLSGPGGQPIIIPLGTLDGEAACIGAGMAVVQRTIAASAPALDPAGIDFLCQPEAVPLG